MNTPSWLHGAVLLLEPTDTLDTLRPKCQAMREIGLNTVVLWPPTFYRNGRRDYSVQTALCHAAHEAGLGVIVELTGQVANLESIPDSDWSDDFLGRTPEGLPARTQGGLGELNYNHPAVRSRLTDFFRETAEALRNEPALCAWDVWNETHFQSYDSWTLSLFQQWLQARYTTIEALNARWKKSYTAFSQIRIDTITWASIAPDLDWEEFRTDNLAAIAHDWTHILHEADPAHPVIADNVMSQTVWSEFGRGTDDWKLATSVDHFGISFYPKTGGRLLRVNEPWLRLLCFAGAYSAGNGHFYVSEMQSHCYSEIFTTERVTPDELLSWNLEALFSGSSGNVYWKWNPFKSGFQVGGRGLVLADGTPGKRARAVQQFSAFLAANPSLQTLRPQVRAAVLFDPMANRTVKAMNNRIRSLIGDDQPLRARYGVARGAWKRNVSLRILSPEQLTSLSAPLPPLLFLPYQGTATPALATALEHYLLNGGTVMASFPFAEIGPDGRLFDDLPGGPMAPWMRIRQIDQLEDTFHGMPLEVQEVELLPGSPMSVLLKTDSGAPLLLLCPHGKGHLLYCTTPLWQTAWDLGEHALETLVWDKLLELCPEARTLESTLPTQSATALNGDLILLIDNEARADHCDFTTTTAPELLFGEGTLEPLSSTLWRIRTPRHAVLRVRKLGSVRP